MTEKDLRSALRMYTLTMTKEDLHGTYDIEQYAFKLGQEILSHCPEGRAKAVALTKLEEVTLWAYKSILE
jgi:hypothetical protein